MNLESGNQINKDMPNPRKQRRSSLRGRITLTTTITAILATIAVGYFTLVRNNETQIFLGNQLQNAEKENAENQIIALVSEEAQIINNFFVDIDRQVNATASYAANLLSLDVESAGTQYWDANKELIRLPNGGWDNSNTDPASIFAPSSFRLTNENISIANAVSRLDFFVPDIIEDNSNILAVYFGNLAGYTAYYPNIDLASLVPADFDPSQRPWFIQAENSLSNNLIQVVWSDPYIDAAQHGLVVTSSIPIIDSSGKFHGVIGADVKLETITNQVLTIRVGQTGYAFLSDAANNIIAMPDLGYTNFGILREETAEGDESQVASLNQGPQDLQSHFQNMANGESGQIIIQINEEDRYLTYAPISSTDYSLGVVVPVSEMDTAYRDAQRMVAQENQQTQIFGLLLLAVVVIGAIIISAGLSRVLTIPLNQLRSAAEQISAGDLEAKIPETSVEEVNVLAKAFNGMTTQLREMLGGLEERVRERTTELEEATKQSQRRAVQFEAIAQVARSISTSQDIETLLSNITNVISQQFGFYHVGVFLLDETENFAVLRAANSPGGKKMLGRNHQLKVGETGIVGFVTSRGKARIALDTGKDIVYFDNPNLPDTRSEMALPLFVGDQIIGALDVQSVEPNAFSQEDIDTLSTLADQVSIAIHNARLYNEVRDALAQSELISQQRTTSGWNQFKLAQNLAGIRRSKGKVTLLKEPLGKDELDSKDMLNLPIILHEQKIGEIQIRADNKREWTQDEIDIATAIIERAAITMENARLLSDAQRLANRERAIGEIASTVSASTDMNTILRSAVQELGRRMGGAEVVLELGTEFDTEEKAE